MQKYFQHCHQKGGELATIMDDSKQQDVKRFVKRFMLHAQTGSNSKTEQLYFWIGMAPYFFLQNLVFTTQSVTFEILLAF